MKRLYEHLIEQHFARDDNMLFLTGPRQVGKTTSSQQSAGQITDKWSYLNWDNADHRDLIIQGPSKVINHIELEQVSKKKPMIIFDEIHKFANWKNFIKGFYDTFGKDIQIMVTGSARLDTYKRGGDSLMGRYFSYRMHPYSVGECLRQNRATKEFVEQKKISDEKFEALLQFGGFPKPYIKKDLTFSNRWHRLRLDQIFNEEIRELDQVYQLQKFSLLSTLIPKEASHTLTYSNLAKYVGVTNETIGRWMTVLESLYFCFLIRPWHRNIPRALVKEPKVYLWDWSLINDPGSRAENFIASHLLKATHYWTDCGLGDYGLFYIRDLEKREVDFVVTKNDEPWLMVEVKNSNQKGISKNLYRFKEVTGVTYAFQVVLDLPFVDVDCFSFEKPMIVPARTFLSQLV
jgi:uncharacterized protein